MALISYWRWFVSTYMGTIQAHRVMDYLLQNQFIQHPEVTLHITMYLFEHRAPRVEVLDLKQRVGSQAKILSQMKNTCKELQSRVDDLTEKSNRLGNK